MGLACCVEITQVCARGPKCTFYRCDLVKSRRVREKALRVVLRSHRSVHVDLNVHFADVIWESLAECVKRHYVLC